jgi:hypothetical protein
MRSALLPHPLAALFPELAPDELSALANDIKSRGQLEPIILYQGMILDGRNRYRACQLAGVKPKIEEFNPKTSRRSPEELILSRNLRRRHLSVGQRAVLALEWSEQVELNPNPEKKRGRGRPKGALSEAAQKIGINQQRVFEVRQLRESQPHLYAEVKAGNRSLNGALGEIDDSKQSRITRAKSEGCRAESGGALLSLSGPAGRKQIEKALERIKQTLGKSFHAEVQGGNLIDGEPKIVEFAKLPDPQMREVGSLLKKGWAYEAAFQEIVERLNPGDEIRQLHSRAVASGKNFYLGSVGDFRHLVIWGPQSDALMAKVRRVLPAQAG